MIDYQKDGFAKWLRTIFLRPQPPCYEKSSNRQDVFNPRNDAKASTLLDPVDKGNFRFYDQVNYLIDG
jgi:hypothetical protein